MARPSDLKDRFTTMVSLEREDYDAFEEFVGKGNVSKELRAMIKDRVAQEKNEKAPLADPLGLSALTQSNLHTYVSKDKNSRQSTLFETFAVKDRRDEIVRFVKAVNDVQTLNQLEQNCKCMLKVSETHRQKIRVYSR